MNSPWRLSDLTDLVMSHLVVVEVAAGCEPLTTHPTLVGLLSGVDPPVGVQAGAGAELLVAEVT